MPGGWPRRCPRGRRPAVKRGQHRDGQRQPHVVGGQRLRHQRGEEHAEREAERGADQRRDHALVADHAARLAPRHPDRPQHPELARALEDREHERVDHAEQAHDHRERQQHVEHLQEAGEALRALLAEALAGVERRVVEADRGRVQRRPRLRPRVEEREGVLRLRERVVEGALRDADVAEQRVDLGRVVDPAHDDRALLARRALQRQPLADGQAPVLRVGLGHQGAVVPEPAERGVRPVGPREPVEARDRRRVDAGDVPVLACDQRLVVAHVRGRGHAVDLGQPVALGGRERHAVLGAEDVGRRRPGR